MKKRLLALFLAIILAFSAFLVSCGKDDDEKNDTENTGDNGGGNGNENKDDNNNDGPKEKTSVALAREAQAGEKVTVKGIVKCVTYANGMIPSGFFVVEGGDSIYVYDRNAAASVIEGSLVELEGTKDYWILENEMENAQKFGYPGCNQLTDVTIISTDYNLYVIDEKNLTETTVKDILETPVTEDITTQIYKVTALINKVVGTGFTNYYINDLDGKTGSYVYTQCNGNDFSWLDQFDGKICTVYVTPINAKSSSTDCFYRFIPIYVSDDGFTFDLANTADHVLKYYALDQFRASYTGDPALELITEVSSELLGFEGAKITYSSDNEDVIFFTEEDGKVTMHCNPVGAANVTVTATYGETVVSKTVSIEILENEEVPHVTVAEAIAAEKGETVTVKGIVGPSLVNRDGFYLIDKTGIISIIVNDATVYADIAIGNEVILTGTRDLFHNGEGSHAGQIAITGTTVVANYYGNHEYDDSNFIKSTVADFRALDVTAHYSTTVFVIEAKIEFVQTAYYTNLKVSDENGTTITLYCSGAGQYSFLNQFSGQTVTMEIAACNWNNKTFYAGCVLSVITEDGKVLNTLNFDSNK